MHIYTKHHMTYTDWDLFTWSFVFLLVLFILTCAIVLPICWYLKNKRGADLSVKKTFFTISACYGIMIPILIVRYWLGVQFIVTFY